LVCTLAEGKEVRVTVRTVVVLPELGTVTPAQPDRYQARTIKPNAARALVRARYEFFCCIEGGRVINVLHQS
jgi:hypothetical protein